MADTFISHLEWTGGKKGPTRDPATFSRDLDVSMDATPLLMSSAPGYRGDPAQHRTGVDPLPRSESR